MNAPGVLLTGATGFIGGHLIRRLRERGAHLWTVARDVQAAREKLGMDVRVVAAPGDIPPDARIDAIVNLAGAPVVGPPWTRARRQLLIDSRVKTTEAVLDWCTARGRRPAVIVSASAIGFYGPGTEAWLDESSPPQQCFQSELCVKREAAANPATTAGMRVVNLRIGLSPWRRAAGSPRGSETVASGCRGSMSTTWCVSSSSRSTTRHCRDPSTW
jgi:NAD dependent epimerase/dehydratase family enzyme